MGLSPNINHLPSVKSHFSPFHKTQNPKVTAMLVGANHLRRLLRSQLSADDGGTGFIIIAIHHLRPHYSTTTEFSDEGNSEKKKESKWFTLPPFAKTVNASELGAKLAGKSHLKSAISAATSAYETTALKWVLKCCPELPRNLVQKLFRLRQVFIFQSNLKLFIRL